MPIAVTHQRLRMVLPVCLWCWEWNPEPHTCEAHSLHLSYSTGPKPGTFRTSPNYASPFLFFFEERLHYVAQGGLELMNLLLDPLCWDYRHSLHSQPRTGKTYNRRLQHDALPEGWPRQADVIPVRSGQNRRRGSCTIDTVPKQIIHALVMGSLVL